MRASNRNELYPGLAVLLVLLNACAAPAPNSRGVAVRDLDPGVRGPVAGVGIEQQDIVSMTDQMLRDMLSVPTLASSAAPPRVIIDSEYFTNDSSQAINKNTITDRLRVGLNRSAQGRMVFVGRQYAAMVAQERDLKRQGVTDVGTTGMTQAQAGADYRLGGRISTLDSRSSSSGMIQRYNQVIFEMVDLENGIVIWSGIYEFARSGADDVIYR